MPQALPRHAIRSTMRPRFGRAADLDECGATRVPHRCVCVCVVAALPSHGRGHRFGCLMPRSALDLAYAPPFSPVWDPILIAALQASAAVRAAP